MEKQIEELIDYTDGGIVSKEVVKDGSLDVTLFCMGSGQSIGEHTSSKKGFLYVIEGEGVFSFKDENTKMNAGKLIFIEEGEVHALQATTDLSFLLVIH